jgi:hypothetical protein
MKSEKLNDFKEVLRNGMIANFEKDGYVAPIVFFFKDDRPIMSVVPPEYISTPEGKAMLAQMIKSFCAQPNVLAAGLIIEANGARMDADSEMTKLVLNGSVKISELKDKIDIIVMIFSTPESEELIAYEVDCENFKVGEKFSDEAAKAMGSTFSNFFNWSKN